MMNNADMPANATPYMDLTETGGELHCDNTGLTKREECAMRAMQGIMSNEFSNYVGSDWAENIAKDAVKQADAILAELEK